MTNDEARAILSPVDVLALTMFGEARGDGRDGSSIEERLAVGCVVRNRLLIGGNRFGATYQQVCWQRLQFSCWNQDDPNSATLWAAARSIAAQIRIVDPLLKETHWLASGITELYVRDLTNGATHYYSPRSMVPVGRVPNWAFTKTPCARVGSHLFFKGV